MDDKTVEHILKKRLHNLKEIHFIDTSILIGAVKALLDQKAAPELRYFARLKSGKYLAAITPVVYGESFFILLRDSEAGETLEALSQLVGLITNENTIPLFPKDLTTYVDSLQKVRDIENRCGLTDARIVAECIAVKGLIKTNPDFEKCNCFLITTEEKQRNEHLAIKLAEQVEYGC